MHYVTPFVGTAGWSIPAAYGNRFPESGTHLERYARVLSAVEINSSFYRLHKPETYARWAASVPDHFRFAVKIPRTITHHRRLRDPGADLDAFLDGCSRLGEKLGPLLVQLPPTLRFEPEQVETFFSALRARFSGEVACEPRHASWFAPEPNALLARFRVARVAADPAVVPGAAHPGDWRGLVYYRLHGSPRIYYSPYSDEFLTGIRLRLNEHIAAGAQTWCIFDNTAEFHATGNALRVVAGP